MDSSALASAVSPESPSALRAQAALAIGQLHARALVAVLRRLLTDGDSGVASNAAYSLGLLRDSASVSLLEELAGRIVPASPDAAWALGQIGAPAGPTIHRLLTAFPLLTISDRERGDALIGALLLAAAKVRPVPLDAVTAFLQHPNAAVRWRAVYAVARPGVPAGVRPVLALRGDPDPLVRSQVAAALRRAAAGDSLRDLAIPALTELARDPDAHARVAAVRSLASFAGAAVRSALLAATHDRDPNVRVTAAQSLGQVLDSSRANWISTWESDTGYMFRRSLLSSAVAAGVPLPALDSTTPGSWARSTDWRRRLAIADASKFARRAQRIAELAEPWVRDPDPRVRVAAYEALAPLADSAGYPAMRAVLLRAAVTDSDFYVRATAIAALEHLASVRDVPRIVQAYSIAQRDSLPDARIAAVKWLVASWRRDSASFSDSVRDVVGALRAPTEQLVATEASGVSLFSRWPTPSGTGHALSWYEERVRSLVIPALAGRLPRAEILTERGTITLELFALDAPITVDNFMTLARSGYYQGVRFHRVVPNFVAQDGDRRGDGNGGPPYTIRDELNRRHYDRGAVGMALNGPDSGGGQYFLTLSPQPHLDGGYTVFAHVVAGLDVMDGVIQGDRISTIRIP
ncbi:MAG: peptidylprolyl isomerase [Gemmatimonadota bacterium]|nr:peptidylprolyl isomerase [Gemmatimonadota bacterium]